MLKTINGDWSLNGKVTVELNGKQYTRRVYDRSDCGLYIVIKNMMYFLYEADREEEEYNEN